MAVQRAIVLLFGTSLPPANISHRPGPNQKPDNETRKDRIRAKRKDGYFVDIDASPTMVSSQARLDELLHFNNGGTLSVSPVYQKTIIDVGVNGRGCDGDTGYVVRLGENWNSLTMSENSTLGIQSLLPFGTGKPAVDRASARPKWDLQGAVGTEASTPVLV